MTDRNLVGALFYNMFSKQSDNSYTSLNRS